MYTYMSAGYLTPDSGLLEVYIPNSQPLQGKPRAKIRLNFFTS